MSLYIYTMNDVNLHRYKDDTIWIVIDNVVYDITSYISREIHPGGNEVFYKYSGTDTTKVFRNIYSKKAWKELEPYKIGYLKKTSFLTSFFVKIVKLFNVFLSR